MLDFIAQYWLSFAFGILAGVITAALRIIYSRMKRLKQEEDAVKDGVLSLLHDRIFQCFTYYIKQGEISHEDLENMESLYKGYAALGGNGTGQELYERVKNLPLKIKED